MPGFGAFQFPPPDLHGNFTETRYAGAIGGDLGGEVTARFGTVAGRRRDPPQLFRVDHIAADQKSGFDHQPLFVEVGGDRHRPGSGPGCLR